MFRKLIDAFKRSTVLMSLLQWIDSDANADDVPEKMPPGKGRVEWGSDYAVYLSACDVPGSDFYRVEPDGGIYGNCSFFYPLCLCWELSEIFGRFRTESGMRF